MLHAGYISGVGQTEVLDWETLCRYSVLNPSPHIAGYRDRCESVRENGRFSDQPF